MSELDLSLGALEIGTTLESFHTIFLWVYMYRLTVTFYGVPAALGETHWTFNISSFFAGIIGALVQVRATPSLAYNIDRLTTSQMYFAHRIRSFTHSWPITLVSWLGSLLQLSALTAIMVIAGKTTLADFMARFTWLVDVALSINLIIDIINTCGLSYYLYRERSGFKGTDLIVDKLVMWVGRCRCHVDSVESTANDELNARAAFRRTLADQAAQISHSWNVAQGQTGVQITVLREQENDSIELSGVRVRFPFTPPS
ncbi:hypothetical protein C8R46DRAFT_1297434 [Mycena filopes]|nr:hypothetical protein C8R46DRAFT_1297434 [Mycena filopes]